MRAYIIRRLLLMVPTLFIVSLIVFLIVRMIPGDIVDAIAAEIGEGMVADVDEVAIVEALGLDVPIPVQYGRWIGVLPGKDGSFSGILQGSLGISLRRWVPVRQELTRTLPVTLELGILGLIIGQLIALPIGIFSALRQDTWGDYIARSFGILCIAIPGFWLGTLVIVFPSIWWNYSPAILLIPFTKDPIGNLKMFIVPATILGMGLSGITMRMTRTMMLEVLRGDYIRTAWAKGLRERVIILRHALKNALIPVVTIVGFQLPVMVGGTVIIEKIFMLPGMGRLTLEALTGRDYTLVSGSMIVFGIAMVLINLLVDLTYAYLDPRVHYG